MGKKIISLDMNGTINVCQSNKEHIETKSESCRY